MPTRSESRPSANDRKLHSPLRRPDIPHRAGPSGILGGLSACSAALLAPVCLSPAEAQSGTAIDTGAGRATPTGDAWFTGPMLANSAATLPRGHVLVEPYVYDVVVNGHHNFGSLTYILYGLTDSVTLGAKPSFARIDGGRGRHGIGMGDLVLQAQYRLRPAGPRAWAPALALSLQHSLPTGRYDRLGDRPEAGLGSGAHATTLSLYAQSAGRLANGRTLRARFNLDYRLPSRTGVRGVSVYATSGGFAGRARAEGAAHIGVALEYSVTRNWALAVDAIADHRGTTRITGTTDAGTGRIVETHRIRPGWSYGVAPGVEYSWTPNIGILFASRFIAAGPTGPASATPAVAVNMVF